MNPVASPLFAFIARNRDATLLRSAFFSAGSNLEYLDMTVSRGRLEDLRKRVRGLVVIAPDAERLEQELVPLGFVAFAPIDLHAFQALFGTNGALPAESDSNFEMVSQSVADRIDWLISRGASFNRQLESWAISGHPELQRLFATTASLAEAQPERVSDSSNPSRMDSRSRSDTGNSDNLRPVTLEEIFGPNGGLANVIPGYELREGQQSMADAVAETLEHDGVLLVEAGTGIGKSLAYLVPSALWSQQHHEPVIVSTYTRGLQEQLVWKDVPLASAAIEACAGRPIKGVALKGRSNYLCLRRWMQESREISREPAVDSLKIKIAIWLESTVSGDRAELTLNPSEDRVFGSLAATTENCLQTVCRTSLGNRCFFNRSRIEAQKANIVVMNHALLLASLTEESSVLGNLDKLIVDEAHHLESVATARFSFSVSSPRVEHLLTDYATLQGNSIVGCCGKAVEALSATGVLQSKPANARKALELLRGAVTAVERGRHWVELFFQATARLVEEQDDTTPYAVSRRILSSTRDQPNWQLVYETWESLDAVFADLLQSSRWLIGELGDANGQSETLEKIEPALLDLSVWRRELEEMQTHLQAAVSEPDSGFVYWVSGRRNAPEATINGAPLDVSELVREELLTHTSSAVLASATMRSQGTFHMMRQQLGINDAQELVLRSPFDYRTSTLLYIARDVPDPRHASYLDSVREAIGGMATALDGRTLALFTSHASIRSLSPKLRDQLGAQGIKVLAQDIDGTPNQLVERMKREPNSVVLGVAAFWEGVDVPGDELSGLIVTRLPFDVPTDPLFAARSELFEQPFQQYALPRAALKFRQGFGRLIRTSSDRGIVAVLDSRIFSKSYGSTFIRSIPECTVHHGSVGELGEASAAWLRSERQSG